MTPATTEVVSSLVDAWDYMTGQYPGHLHTRTPSLAVSLSQTDCAFFNMLTIDRPVGDLAALHETLREARQFEARCPHDAMLSICPEWLPTGAEEVLTEHKMVFYMKMWGMCADSVLLPRRPAPPLDFRVAADRTTALDIGIINAAAYGIPPEAMAVTGVIPDWSGQAYGIVGYDGDTAVTSTLSFITGDMIYIAMVATLPDLHGRGYAEAAMRRAIAEAQAAGGHRRIWLHATAAGRPVYKAMGFADGAELAIYTFGS
ncbi:GNAT family N-acetyltransferase [Sandarakinorhabdus sp. AAP62]|uniref:GNAT family N-acetyltransferase n=1 Tax=Sandarakinorhabdus sp. AAP62 TaxID=1248916 RepID=UPI00035C85DA|nr:GNAT family N-acetyltransferase [Sandarakinorhabdus sp. AAP62]